MSKATTYITAKIIQEQYEVSTSMLRNWGNEGKMEAKRAPEDQRLQNSNYIDQLFGAKELTKRKSKVCCSIVRTEHQRGDLERRVQDLRTAYAEHEIVLEIASGINWSRKKFNFLLDRTSEGIASESWLPNKKGCVVLDLNLLSKCSSILRSKL
jgi:predicted site-specific integrase-resolvase